MFGNRDGRTDGRGGEAELREEVKTTVNTEAAQYAERKTISAISALIVVPPVVAPVISRRRPRPARRSSGRRRW